MSKTYRFGTIFLRPLLYICVQNQCSWKRIKTVSFSCQNELYKFDEFWGVQKFVKKNFMLWNGMETFNYGSSRCNWIWVEDKCYSSKNYYLVRPYA